MSRRQKLIAPAGFSLLELLLVLAVMTGLIFFGFNRYELYQREKDISFIKQSAAQLMQAGKSYYDIHCFDGTWLDEVVDNKITLTVAKLKGDGLIPENAPIQNPLGDDYSVIININMKQATPTPNLLKVTTTLTKVDETSVPWYRKILHAASSTGTTVTWQQLADSPTTKETDSNLWIMKGGLQVFKKQTDTPAVPTQICNVANPT